MKPQRYVERLIAKVSCCVRNLSWRQADVCTVRVSLLCVVAINRLLQTIITDNGTTVSATQPATSLCTIYMLSCNSPRRNNSEITLTFRKLIPLPQTTLLPLRRDNNSTAHTRTHARTHAHARAHTHAHARARAHIRTRAHAHTHTHTYADFPHRFLHSVADVRQSNRQML